MSQRATPHVLVVSTALDTSTDEVVAKLQGRGVRTTRLDTERYPFSSRLTATLGTGAHPLLEADLDGASMGDVTSIWYRRIRSPERPTTMNPGVYDFCLRESRSALLGTLLSLGRRMMSPPERVWAAEHKLLQLATAKAVGLHIPETVVTNDAEQIRAAFHHFRGQMIAKPVRTGYVDYGFEQHAIYTSQVLEEHLEDLSGAHLSPSIFQPLIPKRADVRATFVGASLFVVEIDSQSDPAAVVDWRKTENPALPHRVATLPQVVEERARDFMRRLGLAFGALDFIRTPEGDWVFLEVNPNGQWLWLDDMLNLGITEAIASWLARVEFP
jgi:glutathione synthase/RimK-type ligase-like ATP-grasp enzyme